MSRRSRPPASTPPAPPPQRRTAMPWHIDVTYAPYCYNRTITASCRPDCSLRHKLLPHHGLCNSGRSGSRLAMRVSNGTARLDDLESGAPRLWGLVELREPAEQDLGPLVDLFFSTPCFGLAAPVTELAVQRFIDPRDSTPRGRRQFQLRDHGRRSRRGRADPCAAAGRDVRNRRVGVHDRHLARHRRLRRSDPSGRLFAFDSVGTHRLESRVLLENGRANGALQKIGAMQEGLLRRSVRCGDDLLDQVVWAVLREDWRDRWVPSAARVH